MGRVEGPHCAPRKREHGILERPTEDVGQFYEWEERH